MINLSLGEIHLWHIYDEHIHDADLLAQYHNMLHSEEAAQYKRFYFEKNRHQYLITRAAVRTILSLYIDAIAPAAWEFKKNEYGKPFINNSALTMPLRFNVSHADELIVIAVTLEQEIGVDVEYMPRLGKMLDIASSFFSPSEVKQLFDLPLEQQRNRFFDLWTLKEAYIKACGMGLSIPLDHFSYTISAQGKINIAFTQERNDQPEAWQFWQVKPTDFHKIAMAVKAGKNNSVYSIVMKNLIPLSGFTEVNYPIAHGGIICE